MASSLSDSDSPAYESDGDSESSYTDVPSLQELALTALMGYLDDHCSKPLTSGSGTIKQPGPVTFSFRQPGANRFICAGLQLPGAESIQPLLDCFCGQLLEDSGTRKSRPLPDFMTDFSVSAHGILGSIEQLVCPATGRLVASLDKLSVTSPSGSISRQYDGTAQPPMTRSVGSLMVCLPWPHRGGALVYKQAGHQAKLDWGAMLEQQPHELHWAFLGSRTWHELDPVTAGHRMVLLYSISSISSSPAQRSLGGCLDCAPLPFSCALRSALGAPCFLPDGGQLRFACQQQYDHADKQNFSAGDLRNADLAVYMAARQLGLEVQLQRVWKHAWYPHDYSNEGISTRHEPYERTDSDSEDEREPDSSIVWIRRPQQYEPDSARVDVVDDPDKLDFGESSCMVAVYVQPFSVRSKLRQMSG